MIQRYSAYKDSGIEWIGEIPGHWEVKKLKYISTIKVSSVDKHLFDDELPVTLCNYTDVYKNDFIIPAILESVGTCTEEEFRRFEINKGDVLITKDSETPDDIGVPALVTEEMENTVCGYHVAILKSYSDAILGSFLFRQLQTKYARSYFEINSFGITRYGLGKSAIEALSVFKPPLAEQSQIVEFLDRKTALIDRLIAAKERRIELLKEQRTALINHAVTKGLDPNVKMKDSGIEWIGEIPEHWEVKKITHCFRLIGSGTTPTSGTSEYYDNGEIYWLQTGDLTDSLISSTSKMLTKKAFEDYKLRIYPINSLVIAMYGATIGKVGLLEIETTTNQACCVLASPINTEVRYIFYWFIGFKEKVVSLGYGGGQPNISQETIRSIRVHYPPLQEQQQIVTFLDEETQKIDSLVSLEQRKIDLLKEYRQALISEAVTGKIKVTKE